MARFSILDYLYEFDDPQEQDQVDPQNVPAEGQSQEQPETPQSVPAKMAPQTGNAFRDILGATLSDISYEPIGAAGGRIKIKTSNSHIPLEISWVGPKVTVTQSDGDVIMLSSDSPQEQ